MDDVVLDDSGLLLDRLLRSFHKNKDGHLAAGPRQHQESISETHNIAILYVYTLEAGAYMLHEHYVFSHEPLTYKQWFKLVVSECHAIEDSDMKNFHGVYGWQTNYLQITPLREGDLFIKIDKDGARGVRLSFSTEALK